MPFAADYSNVWRLSSIPLEPNLQPAPNLKMAIADQFQTAFEPPAPPEVPDHEILRRVGQGSYGEVWLARSAVGTYRAVKVVYRARFVEAHPYEREFAGIQKYEPISRTNDGLVDILQIGRNDAAGYFYYIMELADDAVGEEGRISLQTAATYVPKTLARQIRTRGRLPFEECLTLGLTLNLALGHLHRHGLMHRDVKPSNIIFVNGVAKLADIGLVTGLAEGRSFVGTEGFIPPEGPNSPQADIYALGKVLYEAGMGKDRQEFPEPFTRLGLDAESKRLMELNAVLLRACAPKMAERYQTAEEMNADLALLHSGKSVQQRHALERRLKWATRAGVGLAAVMVLGAAPYYWAIKEAHAAKLAAADAKEKLWSSYLAQAQAGRFSHRAGRRFQGLELLRKATEMRPALELRNEAIACLALPDMRVAKEWDDLSAVSHQMDFDFAHGRYVRSDDKGNVSVWGIADNLEQLRLPGFGAPVSMIPKFSPDGRHLVLCDQNTQHTVVWDLDANKPILDWENFNFRTLDFSADSRVLAIVELTVPETGGAQAQKFGGIIHLYALDGHKEALRLPVPDLPWAVRFDPTGRKLAVSSSGIPQVRIFDTVSGAVSQELTYSAGINGIAWHPNGRWLAGAGADGSIPVWDATTGRRCFVLKGHQSAVLGVAFSHSGDILASSGWDGHLRLWDPLTGEETCSEAGESFFGDFSRDDRWIGYHPRYDKIGILEVASGIECRSLYIDTERGKEPKGCAFSPDGHLLASAHKDGLRLWDLNARRKILFQPVAGETFSVGFHPSRKTIVTSGQDGVKEWQLQTAPESSTNSVAFGQVTSLASATDSEWDYASFNATSLALVSGKTVRLLDLDTRLEKSPLRGKDVFRFTALSPDGKWCAAGSWLTDSVYVFNAASGETAQILPACRSTRRLAFSPDSHWLVMCGDEEYRFWGTSRWRSSSSVERKSTGDLKVCAAFSADSRVAALAYSAQIIKLVDPGTGREFATLQPREPQNIAAMAFSPDGTLLAVTTWTQVIQLWDLHLIRNELAEMKLDWDLPPYGTRGEQHVSNGALTKR